MADTSIEEFLDELGNISVNKDCSIPVSDTKKQIECSILDGLWSEDDINSEIETSLDLSKICSLNFSLDEDENFQFPDSCSSSNITVRKSRKKQHFLEDSRTKTPLVNNGSKNQENSSSFLDENNCSPLISENAMHQKNTVILESVFSMDKNSPDVRKKLNDHFDEENNFSPDFHILSSCKNDFGEQLQSQMENAKDNIPCKVSNQLHLEYDKTFEKFLLEQNVQQHVDSVNTEYLGNELIKEAIEQNFNTNMPGSLNNTLDLSMKSVTSLTDDQLQRNLQKDDNLTTVFPKPLKKFYALSHHSKHGNASTEQDQESIVLFDNDKHKIFNNSDIDKTVEDATTPMSSEVQNDFMKPDDVLNSNGNGITSLVSKIDPPLPDLEEKKSTTGTSCMSGNDYLSNKENMWTHARKKKVVILLSDSDSDSVWEDEQTSDDSDCGKYDISLSSRLVKDLTNKKALNTTKAKSAGHIKTASNGMNPTLLPTNQKFSNSSDDDDDNEFEQFLDRMKTPKPKSTPRYSLKSFIVEDEMTDSSEDEDNRFTISFTTPKSIVRSKGLPVFKSNTTPKKRPTLAILPKGASPVKKYNTPRIKATPLKINTKENTKISSVKTIKGIVTPYVNTPHKLWRKSRDRLVDELFKCYNETVFGNKLPVDLPITWNKQMTKTAGFCYYIGSLSKKCRIELSDKVVDSCDRIRDTLIHELCHAATWLIDGVRAGHGPHWKRWAHKAKMVHSDLPPISRCHSYDINYKFTYRCVKCKHSFGRHSKSVNLKTARCPYCFSHLELLPRVNKDGTPAKTRAPTKFSLFVKDNYAKIKAKGPRSSHQEIMKELSKQFSQQVTLG
ncbi:acidic repeat-containing protein-like [Dendronephthya gigantea]|uniref:acidic repeat-containing protein-like n=1 Tax=Dendronephthya gigantea TaxID=151771 RepID=UPI001069A92B|nr:acidic repeat-containing protein-like [Dendronephthya gigantea]